MKSLPITKRLASVLVTMLLLVGGGAAQAQESVEDARAERERARQEKAAAAAELDLVRAEDAALADALAAITIQVNAQELKISDTRRELETLALRRVEITDELAQIDLQVAELEKELVDTAVAAFLSGDEASLDVLEADNLIDALRRSELASQVNAGTSDVLDSLVVVNEDATLLRSEVEESLAAEQEIENDLVNRLGELSDSQSVQAELKAEVEARLAVWEGEYAAAAAEEAKLTEFIREEERKAAAAAVAANPSAPAPSAPSVTGFQWPIQGSVTSGFGYRTHPIFKTKRLHTGLDISGSSGTPIAAANSGTVIFAGWRGGYGNAVIISHGGGITTLYAHQSRLAVSNGQSVNRGDVIGYVGSTGQSTGPHLHFEVRSNGSPIDPRPYLP